jgi:hypothetical protein
MTGKEIEEEAEGNFRPAGEHPSPGHQRGRVRHGLEHLRGGLAATRSELRGVDASTRYTDLHAEALSSALQVLTGRISGSFCRKPLPVLSYLLTIAGVAFTARALRRFTMLNSITTKQTKDMYRLTTASAQLLRLGPLKQNSIKTVSEQYQTTSKTNEKTQQTPKSNEKSKRNTSAKGHRGGSNRARCTDPV